MSGTDMLDAGMDAPPVFTPEAAGAGVTAGAPTPASEPPKRGRGRPKATADKAPARGPGRPTNDDKLRDKVAELYATAGLGVMLVNPELAQQIMANADELAAAWIKLAVEYPKVRRLLERITTTSAVGAFLAVHFRVFGPALLDKVGGLGGLAGLFTTPTPDNVTTGPWGEPTT